MTVEVGDLFAQRDCGAIPVIDRPGSRRLVEIVTDRDTVARALTESWNDPEDVSLQNCCRLMEANRVRRIVVIESYGRCCGMDSPLTLAC
jgi:predicted transcriptional regulator